ncbi:peptidoglycan DD-metalloendopeptidase family protein [Hassallia byssoidea VB512170]|uniref:Peptidoglycan DD-metalloendopeptidase family protein n=1 Tax=Hassallia byssoidea VB512170 TaxID=1304833 RepID=A0A846H8T9_9CYAN|nr:peptidoglycan DD-metalloendopeptidase family protein [Hassalia byssoidea]NEU73358.1 peptidoglycan DD-metalloendopeptidase family protein [Hassalia byssoidea VB512170]
MKRALKEKVKAVLENPPSDDAPVEQLNVVNPYVNRQVRTKAAMIGLAISMGATSLLVTRQGDQAQAAAPVGNQNTASTISAAPNTEVKFAPTPKLEYQAVSSVSVPESPRIVQPTAISQVPGLQAKLELAAPVVARTTTTIQQPVNFQPQVAQKESIPKSYADKQSDRNGIAGAQSISKLNAQPQTVVSASIANSSSVNSQLRAQQDFAINRLQEKSNRLRRSLAQLRSEETKLSQATNSVAPTIAVEKTPQLNANNTALQPSKNATGDSVASLVSRLKQAKVGNAPTGATNPRLTPSPTAYEVKPGDTLGARASDRGTSVSEIIKNNNLNNPNELRINQKLTVPVAENPSTAIKPIAPVTPVQSGSAPEIVTPSFPLNAGLTPSEPSQPSVAANNSSVTIPTAVISDNQIQATAIKPTTDLTTAPAYGIGGDSPIPQKLNQVQLAKKPPEVTRAKNNNPRLRSLQDEIERLRTKYRAQETGNVIVPTESPSNEAAVQIPVSRPDNFPVSNPVTRVNNVAVPIPVPRPMAPNYIAQPQPQFRATGSNNDSVNPDFFFINQTSRQSNPSGNRPSVRIATPPVGVDASASLGAMRGRTVSPDLPPLTAAVDRYLPRAIDPTMPAPSTMTTAYIWPAKGVLTSGFGQRWGRPHKGIDVANGTGTPIYASADGVIEKAGWNRGGYGNVVDIRHNDGSMTRYGHNSKILVQAGQQVHQGDTIALMGSTGFSTGPHSHFEIHPSGRGAVNPIALLPPRV